MANWVAEKRVEHAERAKFYRNLRMMKTRRYAISKAMFALQVSLHAARQQVLHVDERNPWAGQGKAKNADERRFCSLVDEVLDLCGTAESAVYAAATEWDTFAKAKIYYTTEDAA
ncbi:hypothetical protein [Actinoplanes utahensis]|uniref:Uncharacterized protein n=1 Tax=Actinoplanes utahensis TaxID=1869 RepID=A0A0A6UQ92_ACTUT|nr:hypothetical protein [Actinoplanes utahensis]KHD76549.1 hypothetical protein MB27_16215 [Actinoplanes utahensis]